MQQKLSICCALTHRPRVIIFDEPMVGLDPHAIKELKQVFKELKSDGATILISTHMIDSVENYWDVTHIMLKGRIAALRVNSEAGADKDHEISLEELYFQITEGTGSAARNDGTVTG
ncbi:ABC-type transporter ATP-binding protein EcsA [bioreactor metagenome]|uniref:ABC-type transporter ATP-binding protein EcsA n=1 Tax=bioreactor metagenome TaxID=1076179 RepID=A0A645DW21_9ZZZZ